MARRSRGFTRGRTKLPEGRYHVFNRGVRKLGVFLDEIDRGVFVRLMAEFALTHGVWIIAWCLMPNHFHLEIQSTGLAMVRFMHDLQLAYAKRFNKRHKTSGYLFQGRFRCKPIATRAGVAYVSRYIHGNSRDLGVAPESYEWSSCRSYLGIAPTPSWLHPELALEGLRTPGVSDRVAYRKYLSEIPPKHAKANRGDEYEDVEMERVRRLEELLAERLPLLPERDLPVSLRVLVCWAARRIHDIPSPAVARYFGYASSRCLDAAVSRGHRKIRMIPGLPDLVGGDLF